MYQSSEGLAFVVCAVLGKRLEAAAVVEEGKESAGDKLLTRQSGTVPTWRVIAHDWRRRMGAGQTRAPIGRAANC